ncbi:PilN domain-containing protein [Luteibacter pinisoli]|uniref:PilN domain-containing protein n=1 Tax=Luteibacter pinisoli TaxID=2589080 RepID=A0A4Y5Z123_9GAMM|nr:PilN domain-containing protein [Luteibacter pinisoli]QDE38218.1 PilN domain-containing protein [Luteibacter pinisoli]
MARINLLPWRAERRKQREREFYMQLGVAFAAAMVVLLGWSYWMGARVDNQNDRNTYLQGEIKQLDDRIAKIKDLEKVRAGLLQRKQIIEQLQANRSQMVHLFDELVKTIPASARLGSMKQSGDSMSLDGVAQSNSSVAEYMRNIEASPWMGHADLRKTENTHDDSRMPYSFGLDVKLNTPSADAPASSATVMTPPSAAAPAVPAPLANAAKAVTGAPAPAAPAAAPTAATPATAATVPAGAKP